MKNGRGKNGKFISDRSGFTFPRSEMVVEPGTGLVIAKCESDGKWNLRDHPQNKPMKIKPEGLSLSNPRPQNGEYRDPYLIVDQYSGQVPILSEEGSLFLVEGYDN